MTVDMEVEEFWMQAEHCQTEGHAIMQKDSVLHTMLPQFSYLLPTRCLCPLLLSPLPTAAHNGRNRCVHVLLEEAFFEKYGVHCGRY